MMNERSIKTNPLSTYVHEIDPDYDAVPAIRVYPSSPGRVSVQIRNTGPIGINQNFKSKHRKMIAGVALDATQMRELIATLQEASKYFEGSI